MERPATSTDVNELGNKKFVSYLRGTYWQIDDPDGFRLPNEVLSYIDEKILILSPIKALARRIFTSSDRLEVVTDSKSSIDSGWVKNDKIENEDNSKISKISIDLHQLYARPKVTQKLLEDSLISVEEFIQEKIITQMASAENNAFLNGSGECQPKGILSYPLSFDGPVHEKIEAIKINKSNGINDVKILIQLMEKLHSQYLSRAVWIMSRSTASTLKLLKDQSTNRFVWQNSVMQDMPSTIFGHPVIISDDMPSHSEKETSTPIIFGNLYDGYQIAERKNISILRDPYNSKPFVEFYATKRIGGDVVNFDAIKVLYSV